MRASTCFCWGVCGSGLNSPFEMTCVGIGERNAFSAGSTCANSRSLKYVPIGCLPFRCPERTLRSCVTATSEADTPLDCKPSAVLQAHRDREPRELQRRRQLQCHDPRDLRDCGRAVPSAWPELAAWNPGATDLRVAGTSQRCKQRE